MCGRFRSISKSAYSCPYVEKLLRLSGTISLKSHNLISRFPLTFLTVLSPCLPLLSPYRQDCYSPSHSYRLLWLTYHLVVLDRWRPVVARKTCPCLARVHWLMRTHVSLSAKYVNLEWNLAFIILSFIGDHSFMAPRFCCGDYRRFIPSRIYQRLPGAERYLTWYRTSTFTDP